MKYAILLTRADWEDHGPEQERMKNYGKIEQWWGDLARQGKIVGGHQLQPPATGKTVVLTNGSSSVVDGPFQDGGEALGGYGVVDVASLDEAVALCSKFPAPQTKIEIRPVVER